jgi:hypothetical protein
MLLDCHGSLPYCGDTLPGVPTPRKKRTVPLKLYWVSTADHSEDWFMIARTSAQARRLHETAEGYDAGDAVAELVCTLPAEHQGASAWYPSEEVLRACGAEFLPPQDGTDIVRIAGKVYGAGDIVMNVAVRLGVVDTH